MFFIAVSCVIVGNIESCDESETEVYYMHASVYLYVGAKLSFLEFLSIIYKNWEFMKEGHNIRYQFCWKF